MYRLAMFVLLCAASSFVLSLQLFWYYDHPVLLPIYYVIFAILLAIATRRYYLFPARSRLWIVVAALLIGGIPYEVRLQFVGGLLFGNLDPEILSDLTRSWPTYLRATFDVAFYPVIHLLLQWAIAGVVRPRQ